MFMRFFSCILLPFINGLVWYPLYDLYGFGSGKEPLPNSPKKILRTEVIILRETSGRSYPKKEDIINIEHKDHLPWYSTEESSSFRPVKYSTLVEESTWKPAIRRSYQRVKYIGTTGYEASQVVYPSTGDRETVSTWKPPTRRRRKRRKYIDRPLQVEYSPMKDEEESRGTKQNVILPVGIKELHNPQMRRPINTHVDNPVSGQRFKKPWVIRSNPIWRKNSFNLLKKDINCHCQIP
ncbi:hypothetical protein JTE90_011340 [Oedothorax gibbosus]|uniref:Uncharacterized protein n=1 Tax=Oedothorax gibbosus TaxID=931172 RepID=A0AAV6VKL7_9ARAC|nr:hypothetical protein JTE90_011340 [Oedothorax gibbosus]